MFWSFLWAPLFLIRIIWGNLVTNDQAPKVSRNASLFAVALNIVFDVLFIIVFEGGTAGAALATGLAVLGGVLYLGGYCWRGAGYLQLRTFRVRLYLEQWQALWRFGIPSFMSEITFSIGLLLIDRSLQPYGAFAVAAFGLINYLSFFFLRLFTAAMVSTLPIMSYHLGAGQGHCMRYDLHCGLPAYWAW